MRMRLQGNCGLQSLQRRKFSLKSNAPAATTVASATDKPKEDNFFWRNPGYFGLAFAFMIFGWFNRSSKSRDNSDKLTTLVRERRIITPPEINYLRRNNDIRANDLEQLHASLPSSFPGGRATTKEFDKFLIEQLSKKFPTGLKYGVRELFHVY